MATIRKRNDKWQVQVRRAGHRPISRTFHKKTDAQEWARFMDIQVDRRDLPFDPKQLERITLRQLLEKYRDEVVAKKRCKQSETMHINAFLKREKGLAATSIAEIKSHHFSKYRDKRLIRSALFTCSSLMKMNKLKTFTLPLISICTLTELPSKL